MRGLQHLLAMSLGLDRSPIEQIETFALKPTMGIMGSQVDVFFFSDTLHVSPCSHRSQVRMRPDPNIWALVARPCLCHAAGTPGVFDLGESWRIGAGAALRGFRAGCLLQVQHG